MALKLVAALVVANISYSVEASSVAELAAAVSEITNGAAAPAAPAATAKDAPKTGKSVKTETSAASSPPAAEQKTATAASDKKEEKQASTPKAETDYLKTGIPEKIAAYLGDKEAAGYADRRTKMVELLTSFNVKKGPELKPEQFADFAAALDKLAAPAEDDLG